MPASTLPRLAFMLLLSALSTGCVANTSPIFDQPEQVAQFEGLEGDWHVPAPNHLVRAVPTELEGSPGYRTVWLNVDIEDPSVDTPAVVVLDVFIGRVGDSLLAQSHLNADLSRPLLPHIDWDDMREVEQPQYVIHAVDLDALPDRWVLYPRVNRSYLDEVLSEGADVPRRAEDAPRFVLLFDDEPASMREFFAEHADRIWSPDQDQVEVAPAEADDFDHHFERLTGQSFDEAF